MEAATGATETVTGVVEARTALNAAGLGTSPETVQRGSATDAMTGTAETTEIAGTIAVTDATGKLRLLGVSVEFYYS